jgi:hypothetical protein
MKSMKEFFVKIPESGRLTRSEGCFVLPRMNSEFGKNSFFYQTIKIWNCFPTEVKFCSSEKAFALKIRDILAAKVKRLLTQRKHVLLIISTVK